MDEDRSEQINAVIGKGIALLVGFAVVVALGTFLTVRVLGLDESGGDDTVLGSPAPVSPLPTTALPDPDDTSSPDAEETDETGETDGAYGEETDRPGDEETGDSEDDPSARGFELNASPAVAGPMERVNLTGTYAGQDNVALQVQRLEGGTWATFPVTVHVSMGTFETYVQTSQRGDNKFRVYDPDADKASNVVTITIH